MKILGDFILMGIRGRDHSDLNRPRDLDAVLDSLLSHRLVPAEKISSILLNYRWEVQDSFFCLVVDSKFDSEEKSALHSFAAQLSLPHISSLYTFFQNRLVLIVNLTKSEAARESVLNRMLPLLRDNLITAGISGIFTDFKNLYYYYRQALFAYRTGRNRNPEYWYFRWENYLCDYYVSKCCEHTIPEALYPEGLRRLMEHDAENGTEYVKLLRQYLEHDRNIAAASRALYLHRNTFLYRLDRTEKLLQMDLGAARNRFILTMALEIMERGAAPSLN